MTVSSVMTTSSATRNTATTMSTGSSVEDLMNNFMTLLVAQMQNQDPTSPMDNNQLTSQLVQFQTASGVQQLNSTLNNVGLLVTSMQQMNATQWVGRDVLIEGDSTISMSETGNKSFAFSLNSDADTVQVVLTDPQGNAYTAEIKDAKAGVHQYTIDDLTNFQPTVPPSGSDNTYSVSFNASNSDGSAPEVVSLQKATVESISFTTTGAVLQLGMAGTATLGQVYLVE